MPDGSSAVLALRDDVAWTDPRVDGSAVRVVAAGRARWRIDAVRPGTTTIRIEGTGPTCGPGEPCPMGAPFFVLHVTVTSDG